MNLQNKSILITGGTSALGSAFVRKALAAGAKVSFTYFQNETRARELIKAGAEGFALDLSSTAAIDEFSAQFKKNTPALDSLIHNAALVRDHTIQNLSEEDWDAVLAVDLKAPYYLTKKLLPLLFKSGVSPHPDPLPLAGEGKRVEVSPLPRKGERARVRGRAAKIFFITSRVAVQGGFGVANYAAAKAGLIGLAKSLAQELGRKNILVNCVNPGFMKSKMTEGLPEEVIQRNLEASPLGRFSDPDEVADFLAYLCSDQMTQVTGQVLHFESRKI